MNERESGCQQLATSRERLPADARTPEPAQTTSMTAASDSSCRQGAADTQTLFFLSVGDEPHEKGLPKLETMTVSSGVKNDPDAEMVSVDQKDPDKVEVKNGWKKFPIQGDPMEDEEGVLSEDNEAINLCSKDILPASPIQNQLAPSPQPGSMLSAKMRLKKQRLEAAQRMSPTWSQQTSANDALRQLAEVAERKQEEEMMEVESSTPQGSPTPAGSPQPLHSPLPTLRMTPYKPTNGLVATRLTPMSEYEVSSSATSLATLTPTASPQMNGRHLFTNHHFPGNKGPGAGQPTPSPDSAIHSAYYSPSQSPVQSRHVSGFSSPFSVRTTPSLSRNNSDASQYGGSVSAGPASTVSDTSPLSPRQFSPTHSPVQSRHPQQQMRSLLPYHHGSVILSRQDDSRSSPMTSVNTDLSLDSGNCNQGDIEEKPHLSAQTGISRQQLINSPCPVCGDKISGFHYGIFSCESCKGFFKRTVQNKKNYVCLRGAQCPVSISTRKKCPACRFDKCLRTGMKLEAIREDRTRGGRSTYQCSYTLPAGVCPSPSSSSSPVPPLSNSTTLLPMGLPSVPLPLQSCTELESNDSTHTMDTCYSDGSESQQLPPIISRLPAKANVPPLLQEIMDVEHLWFSSRPNESAGRHPNPGLNPEENMVQTLADMADKRLYKLVKWCKSLPLFKNILIDDQIALLINAWCELLVFSCCYRSVNSPGSIKVSNEKILTQESAREYGIEKWVEKMLNFSDQMRRLKVDYYEYVSMKVIILLTSDASSLKEAEHVRDSQEKVVQALQQYTYMNSPNLPTKFAELLLRMPELHRVCQVGKEMLCPRQPAENDGSGFNLLLELLRGDH